MQHIIATRLGLGVARPTFYNYHISLLEAGLFKSLQAQTDLNFEWVVMCDVRIDPKNRARIEALFDYVPGRILLHDPIKTGSLLPKATEIVGELDSRNILTTRIDDDDVVSVEFVATLQAAARECSLLPTSLALATGIDLYSQNGSYRRYHHISTPVGISLLVSPNSLEYVYSENHNRLHDKVKSKGGDSKVITTELPMWIYVWRKNSDSHEPQSSIHRRGLVPIDSFMREAMERCALPPDWAERISALHDAEDDPRPAIECGKKINRLTLKYELLAYINELKKEGRAGEEDDNRFHAAVSAFYAF